MLDILDETATHALQSKMELGSGTKSNLDSLQTTSKERLTERKFLIVLEGMWNENYVNSENMSRPFKHGDQGSMVLVTTRNETVVNIMRTAPIYCLEHLRDEDCWQLFYKHAFDNEDLNAYPDLVTISRRVFEKCKGLPSAG
ncbi:putative disease resistance RPP13-like protein 1 [Ziziphus jujuba]|uniref:Disease resistance RPP13-like protein 1 n=1 Tax=Ziziphus jujuba TaxID=326968 RepID=A0ABM3ZX84_ZIZJJ|nr:putative disease resistance RPP13-like protein 1 [Ziziphus jujuba]XP_060669090.1 putative disease resistance RPP13-like protein 1 [Ziziphus jujuba]